LFQITEKKEIKSAFNAEFITRIIPRLEWGAIVQAAEKIGCPNLPAQNEIDSTNEEFLQKLHHILLEIDIVEGSLECPETGRQFHINDGIPNMLLNEDEV
jgi:multifunctional methyltransferase subunit TRM112